jgi:hypothetical protein
MKCLLRSGDTKSIMYYASVSRNRDIYILVGRLNKSPRSFHVHTVMNSPAIPASSQGCPRLC